MMKELSTRVYVATVTFVTVAAAVYAFAAPFTE